MIAHKERAHARLAPSAAERWTHCPPSIALGEAVGYEDVSSIYAMEGTFAHELAELKLRRGLGEYSEAVYNAKREALLHNDPNSFYSSSMEEYTDDYVAHVLSRAEAAAKGGAPEVRVEHRVDMRELIPECYGTADCLILAPGYLEVIDLKYGKGVEVEAQGNPQLKLYALGALTEFDWLYGIEMVRVNIAQVRLGNFSEAVYGRKELLEWGQQVREKALLAQKGEGDVQAGSWCRWCPVRAQCRERAESFQKPYQAHKERPKELMTVEEVAELLQETKDMATWLTELNDYALQEALNGTKIPGFKVVEGRSNRRITDEDRLARVLRKEGYKDAALYKPKSLQSITALEKLVGKKFMELAGELVIKPKGKPTLVEESDKRPEWFESELEDEFNFK